ncbi:hypothetical protein WME79_42265 [Sorangium sp. So ce726]|uniref:hypothetical protein n=1 Tax=Sorangium sp. So ce726 TaxID=3133319 RepID=UPI003F61606C
MNRSTRVALALLFTAASLGNTGCQSQDRPIGGGEPSPDSPDSNDSSAAALLIARWEGYIENYQFPSGTDVIQLDIDTVEGTSIQGKVRFGAGASVPPPVDPDVGYPPSADPDHRYDTHVPSEGFDFTMFGAQLTDRRLLFFIDPRELWKGWCELQTSYPVSPGSETYLCMPNEGWSGGPDVCYQGGQPADCGYLELCGSFICDCRESGCTVDAQSAVGFDVAIDEQEANGSITFGSKLYNVRLTRDP